MFYDFEYEIKISGDTPEGPVKYQVFGTTGVAGYMLERRGLIQMGTDAILILPSYKLRSAKFSMIDANFPSKDAN